MPQVLTVQLELQVLSGPSASRGVQGLQVHRAVLVVLDPVDLQALQDQLASLAAQDPQARLAPKVLPGTPDQMAIPGLWELRVQTGLPVVLAQPDPQEPPVASVP